MKFIKRLFAASLVFVVACDVTAQPPWLLPPQNQEPLLQIPVQQSNSPPPAAPFDKCQVREEEKIQCGTPEITAEQCENINCCHDGRHCYYGKAVTVQCTRDGQFVVVVARDATLPQVDVESVTLLEMDEASCSPVDATSAFVIFQFPVTSCGTILTEEDGYVVYENHMSSSYEVGVGERGSITRDSHFELLFQCRYFGSAVEALVMEVNSLPAPVPVAALGPLRVELRLGNGQCHRKGCVEAEAAYTSFYTAADYPVTKVLREPVYVEVHILERSDPNVVLNLEQCWATSNPDPQSTPQWNLLVDGCPYADDRYQTTVVPVDHSSGLYYPTHYKRFIMRMFSFVDHNTLEPQRDSIFIHCATAVCHQSSTFSCEQPCHRQKRAATEKIYSQRALVSSKEVILTSRPSSASSMEDQSR
ncbi:zona pellucida sperm-binding protein 4-like [Synchiropus picturatus]